MTTEDKVRIAIKNALDECDSGKTPHVCNTKSTTQGYQRIESLILSIMIKNNLTPSEAIGHIENEEL
ncbi:hypothetical protein ACE193_15155 [Bernardetia sp. OM2101]|uniref:hypothetical protein n=1 Tax=Bernardetia sp. OM2101 TaxID=3344876 RepID=UPI0035D1232E